MINLVAELSFICFWDIFIFSRSLIIFYEEKRVPKKRMLRHFSQFPLFPYLFSDFSDPTTAWALRCNWIFHLDLKFEMWMLLILSLRCYIESIKLNKLIFSGSGFPENFRKGEHRGNSIFFYLSLELLPKF